MDKIPQPPLWKRQRCNDCCVVTGYGVIEGATLCLLHAAAPALLEALEDMAASHTKQFAVGAGCWCEHCDKARAAIAQAKGETV